MGLIKMSWDLLCLMMKTKITWYTRVDWLYLMKTAYFVLWKPKETFQAKSLALISVHSQLVWCGHKQKLILAHSLLKLFKSLSLNFPILAAEPNVLPDLTVCHITGTMVELKVMVKVINYILTLIQGYFKKINASSISYWTML